MGPEFFLAASRKHTEAGKAVEILPKGVAVKLSEGVRHVDHTGIERDHIRARWWELPDPEIGYDWLAFPHNPEIPALPVKAESFEQIPGYALDAPHPLLRPLPQARRVPLSPERHNVACLDHAAAKDGPLVAYRWKEEAVINPQHYVPSLES